MCILISHLKKSEVAIEGVIAMICDWSRFREGASFDSRMIKSSPVSNTERSTDLRKSWHKDI